MTPELADIEMAAHGGAVVEIRRENGTMAAWSPDSQIRAPHHADTPMEITGPAAGHERAEDQGRSDRPPRPRHAQQLRRRHHAVGHVAHLRGELQRLLLGQARRRPSGGAQLQALRRARQRATPGASVTTASTSPRSRTRRTASAGSSRSIRSIRPRRRRSAPRSAASSTKAPPASSTRTAATSSTRATTSASTTSTSSSPPARVDRAEPRRQPRPARRRHALRRALQRRRQRRLAAAGPRPGPADGGERLRAARPTC